MARLSRALVSTGLLPKSRFCFDGSGMGRDKGVPMLPAVHPTQSIVVPRLCRVASFYRETGTLRARLPLCVFSSLSAPPTVGLAHSSDLTSSPSRTASKPARSRLRWCCSTACSSSVRTRGTGPSRRMSWTRPAPLRTCGILTCEDAVGLNGRELFKSALSFSLVVFCSLCFRIKL